MMPLGLSFAGRDPTMILIWMIAWFLQMGLHEGGHAWAAWWLGDDTAYMMGKRTINPLKHINWHQPMSWISGVAMPLITVITLGFPLGMAWVPVNVARFRNPARDHALVAAAGPGGDFVVALVSFLAFFGLYPLLGDSWTIGSDMAIQSETAGAGVVLLARLAFCSFFASIIYGTFNLIPIPPMDGSRILYYFGNWRMREFLRSIERYGFFIIIVLFWILPGGWVIQPVVRGLTWVFFRAPMAVWD